MPTISSGSSGTGMRPAGLKSVSPPAKPQFGSLYGMVNIAAMQDIAVSAKQDFRLELLRLLAGSEAKALIKDYNQAGDALLQRPLREKCLQLIGVHARTEKNARIAASEAINQKLERLGIAGITIRPYYGPARPSLNSERIPAGYNLIVRLNKNASDGLKAEIPSQFGTHPVQVETD